MSITRQRARLRTRAAALLLLCVSGCASTDSSPAAAAGVDAGGDAGVDARQPLIAFDLDWVKPLPYARFAKLSPDTDDRVWVAGSYTARDAPTGPVRAVGGSDGIVRRYLPTGEPDVEVRLESTGPDSVDGIDVEPSTGRVVIAGRFGGVLTLGATTLTSAGRTDAFVAVLEADGRVRSAFSFGAGADDAALDVRWTPSGSILVGGTFRETIRVAPDKTLTSAGGDDGFVAVFDESGTSSLAIRVGGPSADTIQALAADASGNVFVTGVVQGVADIGDRQTTGKDLADFFAASFTRDGVLRWTRRLSSSTYDQGESLAIARDGSILIGGIGNIDFEPGRVTGGFVSALSPDDGATRWATPAPHDGVFGLRTVEGGLVAAGIVRPPRTTVPDGLVALLTNEGAVRGTFQFGGAAGDGASDAVVARDGSLVFVGTFSGEATFGTQKVVSLDESDAFLAKVHPRP